MVAQLVEPERAYYSVLRWRPEPARDEPKNIGVLVSGIEGDFFELRSVNLGRVSTKIAEQGLLDRMVEGLRERFTATRPTLGELRELRSELRSQAVTLTEPRPAAVVNGDPGKTVNALFAALVRPAAVGGGSWTKGRILDRVVPKLRRRG